MSHITAARALTALVARRLLRIATLVACAVFVFICAVCWLLATFLNGYWWLLIIPFAILFGVFLVLRLVVAFIIRRIHTERLSVIQKQALNQFVDKLQRLIEARGTPPIFILLISLKDLLLHRDITTIKSLIADTVSLRRDYKELERLFN